MAFQVIFAEILDKKLEEGKVFSYTAMRLRQIGEDLEKIKLVRNAYIFRAKNDRNHLIISSLFTLFICSGEGTPSNNCMI